MVLNSQALELLHAQSISPVNCILYQLMNCAIRKVFFQKVTSRFNKLIYILFKDVQCTFCLIQGSRVSRNFYLHMYRPRTAVMSEDARAAVSLLLAEHVSQTPNSETTLRDHRGISRERSPQRRTRKGKGKVKGAETSTLFLGRLWRWW